MPRIIFTAPIPMTCFLEGPVGQDGDAILGLYATHDLMRVAHGGDFIGWKEFCHHLYFLQANDLG